MKSIKSLLSVISLIVLHITIQLMAIALMMNLIPVIEHASTSNNPTLIYYVTLGLSHNLGVILGAIPVAFVIKHFWQQDAVKISGLISLTSYFLLISVGTFALTNIPTFVLVKDSLIMVFSLIFVTYCLYKFVRKNANVEQ